MENKITVHEKDFTEYISSEKIQARIKELAQEIDQAYAGSDILMVGNLTGAFIILADLCRYLKSSVDVKFVKYTSYAGMETTHVVEEKMGFDKITLTGRHILIVEDIIDTGITLDFLLEKIRLQNPLSVKVFTLLLKPDSVQKPNPIDYVGFEIANDFVIGYGLDYDGMGRDLDAIYCLST